MGFQFSVLTLLGITTAIAVVLGALPYPAAYPALYFLGFNLVIFALAGGLSPPQPTRRI